MHLYIVEFWTGEYDDFQSRIVCAYRTRRQANTHAWNANVMLKAKGLDGLGAAWRKFDGGKLDPGEHAVDYNGGSYEVLDDPVPLMSRVPRG